MWTREGLPPTPQTRRSDPAVTTRLHELAMESTALARRALAAAYVEALGEASLSTTGGSGANWRDEEVLQHLLRSPRVRGLDFG